VKLKKLAQMIAVIGIVSPAIAQEVQSDKPIQRVEITGSSIKRIAREGALPLEVISRKQLQDQGIVTAEQLIATLNVNGNGSDNLASNADVTSGAQRGNNGASSANLRGQGADSTLVLLNGRRVATYGMKGSAVDLNSIPMSAVERVEVLKDGASAVYGTDAIGGVINFITKKDYRGLEAEAFDDATQHGGSNIARVSVTGGWGDLDKDGFNLLVTGSRRENKALRGDQRDFVNTFQPNRGVSVDTRGSPFANVFGVSPTSYGKTLLGTNASGVAAATGTQLYNGISLLDLPGGKGCNSIDGMAAYDEKLWDTPGAAYGCAWDTGRAAVLQQPVENNNGLARLTYQPASTSCSSSWSVRKSRRPRASRQTRFRRRPSTSRTARSTRAPAPPTTRCTTSWSRCSRASPPTMARRSPTAGAAWSAATARSRPRARPAASRWAPTVR
jgi:iron complex outermembrane receptor protein